MTGGIGSGKTTVARIFEQLGIPVYYADARAKSIIEENAEVRQSIIHHFGENSFRDGIYDRGYMSSIVFNNPERLKLLNDIVHPFTISDATDWMKKQSAPYAIKEAALIFESGSDKHLDKVIGVSAPLESRVKRVMQRDGISEMDVLKKMNLQMGEDEKMKRCDYIIRNDETEMVIPQVLKLHELLFSLT